MYIAPKRNILTLVACVLTRGKITYTYYIKQTDLIGGLATLRHLSSTIAVAIEVRDYLMRSTT